MAMMLHASKKGFFFTIAAIALSIVLILSFKVYDTQARDEKNDVIAARILTINDFIKDVESDMEKGLYISSKRTFLGMQEYITEQGSYVPSTAAAFEEGILLGTIGGTQVNLTVNSTFTHWTRKIQEQAEKVDIESNFTILSLSLTHADPWSVNITASIMFNASDRKKTASWLRIQEISTKIAITELEDPLYVVETSGKITNSILVTNLTPLVMGGDVANLKRHANVSYYVASNYSPSYLMRLEGNMSPSPFGIESLVNVEEFEANGVATPDRSIVDAVYFGNISTTDFHINDTPSWFKIDSDRLEMYGVEGLTTN